MTMEAKFLICDCYGHVTVSLNEAKSSANGRITFSGPFSETDRKNRNNRVYPEDVFRPEFDRLRKLAENSGLIGELDHPENSILHMDRASHVIQKMWWETSKIGYGQCRTLSTPMGLTLEAFFHEGVPVGISSRGVGNGQTDETGTTIIKDGFKLITYDAVADPSYQDAWQQIAEEVQHNLKTTKVSMATPAMIRQDSHPAIFDNGGNGTGYKGPVVRKRIEEAIQESLTQPKSQAIEAKAQAIIGAFSKFYEDFDEGDLGL